MKVGLEYVISGLVDVVCMWISDLERLEVDEVIEQLSEIHFNNNIGLVEGYIIELRYPAK